MEKILIDLDLLREEQKFTISCLRRKHTEERHQLFERFYADLKEMEMRQLVEVSAVDWKFDMEASELAMKAEKVDKRKYQIEDDADDDQVEDQVQQSASTSCETVTIAKPPTRFSSNPKPYKRRRLLPRLPASISKSVSEEPTQNETVLLTNEQGEGSKAALASEPTLCAYTANTTELEDCTEDVIILEKYNLSELL